MKEFQEPTAVHSRKEFSANYEAEVEANGSTIFPRHLDMKVTLIKRQLELAEQAKTLEDVDKHLNLAKALWESLRW